MYISVWPYLNSVMGQQENSWLPYRSFIYTCFSKSGVEHKHSVMVLSLQFFNVCDRVDFFLSF